MIYFCIGVAVIAALYFGLWRSSAGKFWHNHEWCVAYEHQAPSMYSKKKLNVHTVYKCANCSAFRVDTDVIKLAETGA